MTITEKCKTCGFVLVKNECWNCKNPTDKKQIGIVCDNYKLNKFEKELQKAGFQYKTVPFTSESTSIIIITEAGNLMKVKKIVEKVEFHFKLSN